ncbi:DUF3153 domain-containing protein [Leptothermofonsia sp. ETS-13]|uniref:DUF3153 domain-containing protein n=1 Tax=Leptothermofonsia sp. ETS-13 TaxID=3035696 RepID=UPI003BA25EB4
MRPLLFLRFLGFRISNLTRCAVDLWQRFTDQQAGQTDPSVFACSSHAPAVAATHKGLLKDFSLLGIILFVALLLSGCVEYDIELQFQSPSHGQIVQHIHLAERLQTLSGSTTQQWLDAIAQRSRNLGGQVERLPNQEIIVTIPFSNHTDLEAKFNQFFSSSEKDGSFATGAIADLPEISSHLELTRSNFLLVERNHLRYDLDLRSLGVLSSSGDLLLSPGDLINLEFGLTTPWGGRSLTPKSAKPEIHRSGKELVWQLVPGELNHLEAVFWLANPLGIGTLIIVLLVFLGTYLKYPQRFGQKNSSVARSPDSHPDTAT